MKAPSATYKLQSANDTTDECPAMINEMKIGQSTPVKTAQPMMAYTPKKIIDLGNTSSEDLKSIEKLDPFMFYSIPGARRATMLNQDIDTSHIANTSSRISSCQGRFQSAQSNQVTRSTCISVEAHPDMLFEDDLLEGVEEKEFDFDFTDDFSDLDLLLRFYKWRIGLELVDTISLVAPHFTDFRMIAHNRY